MEHEESEDSYHLYTPHGSDNGEEIVNFPIYKSDY